MNRTLSIRLDEPTALKLEGIVERLNKQSPAGTVTPSDVVRAAILQYDPGKPRR